MIVEISRIKYVELLFNKKQRSKKVKKMNHGKVKIE